VSIKKAQSHRDCAFYVWQNGINAILFVFYLNNAQYKVEATIAPAIGAKMATQAYSQCDDPLNFNGNRAWTNRGPKSRAGFKPGPVAPPNDVTNVATKTPSARPAIPL